MNSGLYTAYSGLRAQSHALEVIANNLANINTTGFKEERAFFSLLEESIESGQAPHEISRITNRSVRAHGSLNTSEGSLVPTNRDLDIAITGQGFLVVQAPQGIRYTRNGNLALNAQSVLTTSEGFPVLGVSGRPITLGPGKIQISGDGTIMLDNRPVDQLKLTAFGDISKLDQEGSSLFIYRGDPGSVKAADATVQSGYLEQSNVNSIASVVRMIEIMRHFEAIQKSVNLLMNDVNAKAIDKLGR